jgi:hypothetical protein
LKEGEKIINQRSERIDTGILHANFDVWAGMLRTKCRARRLQCNKHLCFGFAYC